jgi:integrase/recombinase XerD
MPRTSTQSAKAPKGKRNLKPSNRPPVALAAALKSFIGHLEGSGKARHTVDAYRFDLQNFAEFLEGTPLSKIVRKDLERYQDWLKLSGEKTNTRRRKIMTVRKFMFYLTARKKIAIDIAKKLPAPGKIERVPETIDLGKFREAVRALEGGSHLAHRNIALLGLLIDTGCSVSEAAKLRWQEVDAKSGTIRILGKAEREIKLSPESLSALSKLREYAATDELCFIGFNRHGPMRVGKRALGITPRGIEMLVKSLSGALGFPRVTPRTLRHSAVVEWYRNGVGEDEIQIRLGLKTPYAFRIYAPIFTVIREGRPKSTSEATSTA